MHINELRIGNILKEGKVKSIYYDGKIGLDSGFVHDIDTLNSIPLTEQWLIKFGFVGDSILGSQTLFKKDNVEIWAFRVDGTFMVDNIKRKAVHLKSVYQLQNLFFSLTGEELVL